MIVSEQTKKIIDELKKHDFLDLGFLLNEPASPQPYEESKIRDIASKGDFLLGIYIHEIFQKYLTKSTLSYLEILDTKNLGVITERLTSMDVLIGNYYKTSGSKDVEERILTILNNLVERKCDRAELSNVYGLILSLEKFMGRSIGIKTLGELPESLLTPVNFDKLLYIFDSTESASSFLSQAKTGIYTVAVCNDKKPELTHMMLGVKFTDIGGILMSDGDYNPNTRSRTNRKQIERMEKSLFPYSLLNVVSDGKHIYNSELSSNQVSLDVTMSLDGFIGYKNLSDMDLDDALGMSIFLNQLHGFNWKEYIKSFPETNGRYEVKITSGHELVVDRSNHSISIPRIVNRKSMADALSVRSNAKLSSPSSKKDSDIPQCNIYWESVFKSEIDNVILSADRLLESKEHPMNTVLVEVDKADSMTASHDVVINTIKNARMHQSIKLKSRIDNYFDDHYEEMKLWICEQISQESIFNKIIKNLVTFNDIEVEPEAFDRDCSFNKKKVSSTLIELGQVQAFTDNLVNVSSGGFIAPKQSGVKDERFLCAVTGAKAQYRLAYHLNDCYDISSLLGVIVEDLPFHLSQFGLSYYNGNSILNDIDPVQSLSHKYHDTHRMSSRLAIAFPVSISGINKIRKELGVSKITKDELEKEESFRKITIW